MKITMIGTGYVGLVTGTCFAESGNDVTCLDIDSRKIQLLNDGGVPIYEPGLEELVKRNTSAGRLSFTDSYEDAISAAECVFICVGTPQDESGRRRSAIRAECGREHGSLSEPRDRGCLQKHRTCRHESPSSHMD